MAISSNLCNPDRAVNEITKPQIFFSTFLILILSYLFFERFLFRFLSEKKKREYLVFALALGTSSTTSSTDWWAEDLERSPPSRLFCFYIFRKHFLQKYIFNITIYSFVPLPPDRGAAGGLPPSSGAAGTYM